MFYIKTHYVIICNGKKTFETTLDFYFKYEHLYRSILNKQQKSITHVQLHLPFIFLWMGYILKYNF